MKQRVEDSISLEENLRDLGHMLVLVDEVQDGRLVEVLRLARKIGVRKAAVQRRMRQFVN